MEEKIITVLELKEDERKKMRKLYTSYFRATGRESVYLMDPVIILGGKCDIRSHIPIESEFHLTGDIGSNEYGTYFAITREYPKSVISSPDAYRPAPGYGEHSTKLSHRFKETADRSNRMRLFHSAHIQHSLQKEAFDGQIEERKHREHSGERALQYSLPCRLAVMLSLDHIEESKVLLISL